MDHAELVGPIWDQWGLLGAHWALLGCPRPFGLLGGPRVLSIYLVSVLTNQVYLGELYSRNLYLVDR